MRARAAPVRGRARRPGGLTRRAAAACRCAPCARRYAGTVADVVTNMDGSHISPTTALGPPQRGAVVTFAGLIIVDIANMLLTFFLPDLEASAAAAAKAENASAPEAAAV